MAFKFDTQEVIIERENYASGDVVIRIGDHFNKAGYFRKGRTYINPTERQIDRLTSLIHHNVSNSNGITGWWMWAVIR